MSAPLADVAELELRLGITLTGTDSDRAQALLADASSAFRDAAGGQQFTLATTTDRLRVRNRRVTLPQRPVAEVSTVVDLNAVAVTYTLYGDVLHLDWSTTPLNYWEVEPRRSGLSLVDVTYTHGYEQIPDDVVAVVCQMAARAFGVKAQDAGLQQESLGSYSYTVGTAAASGAVGMLPDERRVAENYRRELGFMSYAP